MVSLSGLEMGLTVQQLAGSWARLWMHGVGRQLLRFNHSLKFSCRVILTLQEEMIDPLAINKCNEGLIWLDLKKIKSYKIILKLKLVRLLCLKQQLWNKN